MSQQSEIEQVSSWGGSESWVRTLDANLKSLQEANKFYSEVVRLQHLNLGWFQENFMRGGQSLFVALEFVERGRIFFSRSVKIGTRKYDCLPAKTAKELRAALRDIEKGKNLSPAFSSGKEMDAYLGI